MNGVNLFLDLGRLLTAALRDGAATTAVSGGNAFCAGCSVRQSLLLSLKSINSKTKKTHCSKIAALQKAENRLVLPEKDFVKVPAAMVK